MKAKKLKNRKKSIFEKMAYTLFMRCTPVLVKNTSNLGENLIKNG
jgi:hypothetical protein